MAGNGEIIEKMVENTKKELNNLKEITVPDDKKLDSKFVKKYPQWEEYFKLYNDCVKKVNKYKTKYLKALDSFSKNYSNIYENTGALGEYTQNLLKACEEASTFVSKGKKYQENALSKLESKLAEIKKFFSNLDPDEKDALAEFYDWKPEEMTYESFIGYYEKSVLNKVKGHFCGNKSITLNILNKERRECSSSMDDINSKFTTLKGDISSKLGVLNFRSLTRNIAHLKGSPFDILNQLYTSLIQVSNGKEIVLPEYKNKDLLKMQKGKTLDKKISNSMKKVINCNWDKYNDIKKEFGDNGNLSTHITSVDKKQNALTQAMNGIIKEMKAGADKPDPAITENLLTKLDKATTIIDGSADKYNEKAILSLYARTLSVRMGASIVSGFFAALDSAMDQLPKVDSIETLSSFAGVTTESTLSRVIKFAFEAISFALSFVPVVGHIAETCVEGVKDIIDKVSDMVSFTSEKIQTIKETYEECKG